MCMKIEEIDDLIVVYLMNTYFESINKNNLLSQIKDIFIRLIEYYHYELKGIYNVYLYENIKYGTVIEINKTDELLFSREIIDIKLKIYNNKKFYFKTNDIFYIKNYKNIYYDNGYYYINLDDVDNLLNIIEYGKIIYKEKDNYLNKMKFIQ